MGKTRPKKHITVAVGCIFRENQIRGIHDIELPSANYYQFLLVRRREQLEELDKIWELPGGKVEQNELPINCVKREIVEETGYRINVIEKLKRNYVYVRKYPGYNLYVQLVGYIGVLQSSEQSPVLATKKIDKIKWFGPNEINYRNTLQGSREFIVDAAKRLGIQVEVDFEKRNFLIAFYVPDPKLLRFGRWYSLSIQYITAMNEYMIVLDRGGKKKAGRTSIIRSFNDDYEKMLKYAKKKISERISHGYVITECDEDFPLKKWIQERGYPVDLNFHKKYPIQIAFDF